MKQKELKTKETIEKALLNAMKELDTAIGMILSLETKTDNSNYFTISQAKTTIKRVLQRNYDRLARDRS